VTSQPITLVTNRKKASIMDYVIKCHITQLAKEGNDLFAIKAAIIEKYYLFASEANKFIDFASQEIKAYQPFNTNN
jgi:hypothetical protein